MEQTIAEELALSISDLGIRVVGFQRERVSWKFRLNNGPFVKLGEYARLILVGSAMPDALGSVYAISTMAQCLSLIGVPTVPFHVYNLTEDIILSLVFRSVEDIEQFQALDPSPIRKNTPQGAWQQNTH